MRENEKSWYIFKGDYKDVGSYVMIPLFINGETEWLYKYSGQNELKRYREEKGNPYGTWRDIEKRIADAITVSRRKIKKPDIVLCSMIYDSVDDSIVFTEEKIYAFGEEKLEYIIEYKEIDEVDFDEKFVILKLKDGKEVSLYCDNNSSYTEFTKNMYNFIMDILEVIE